jgi:hypothetical protein
VIFVTELIARKRGLKFFEFYFRVLLRSERVSRVGVVNVPSEGRKSILVQMKVVFEGVCVWRCFFSSSLVAPVAPYHKNHTYNIVV